MILQSQCPYADASIDISLTSTQCTTCRSHINVTKLSWSLSIRLNHFKMFSVQAIPMLPTKKLLQKLSHNHLNTVDGTYTAHTQTIIHPHHLNHHTAMTTLLIIQYAHHKPQHPYPTSSHWKFATQPLQHCPTILYMAIELLCSVVQLPHTDML